MKRSRRIALVLLSGASAGMLASCSSNKPVRISSQSVYANNYFLPGVGYYHAPFGRFFPTRYNERNRVTNTYFAGGFWRAEPFQSEINLSAPSPEEADRAEAARTDVDRGGFGRFGGGYG